MNAPKESSQTEALLPKDGHLLALILKSMNITECEPQVIPQLLEFMYRHATELLQDSLLYAEHAGRSEILLNDLRFAIHCKSTHSFIPPPSREVLLDIASKKNAEPLPLLSPDRLLRLPPDEHCLFGQQTQIASLSGLYKTTSFQSKESAPRPGPSSQTAPEAGGGPLSSSAPHKRTPMDSQ